jgi:erythromycin esterase-like protein
MEWLRQWNLGAGKAHPVSVYGADLPARSGSMVPALDRLAELTAGDAAVKSAIDAVRPSAVAASGAWWREADQKYAALSTEAKAALTKDVEELVDRVQSLSLGDEEKLAWARRLSQLVRQNEAVLRLGGFSPTAPRDVAMFENTMWVLERLGKEERAVYWAHNAHVQKVMVTGGPLPPGRFPSAGSRFATALGKKYFAIATAYGGPSMDKATEPQKGSVDAALATASKGSFLLRLWGAHPPAVEAWLASDRPMRFQVDHIVVALGRAFDAVAFFDGAVKATRIE